MKNRLKKAWDALKDNRGSGVVLVLVAISCITLMTTSLLHLSYTAFRMKAAERQNKVEFYDANAKLDELVTELQNQVSAAISKAQKEVLVNYSDSSVNHASLFQRTLIDEVESSIKLDELERMLNPAEANYKVKIAKENVTFLNSGNKYTLQNVAITYVSDKSSNSTTITTDIIIDVNGLDIDSDWNVENTVKLENWSIE